MMGKKYFCAILCTLFISSILISDVSARADVRHHHSKRSHSNSDHGHHHHSGSSSHHKIGNSGSHSSTNRNSGGSHIDHQSLLRSHNSPDKSGSVSKRSYPPSNNKLSGSGPATYSSTNYGTNSGSGAYGYPTTRPGSLSGNGNGYGYPSSKIQPSYVKPVGSIQHSGTYRTNNTSGSYGYPTARPGSLSGSGSSGYGYQPTTIKPSFGTQLGAVPNSGTSRFNTSSGTHSYPTSRPGSLSGGGNGGSNTAKVTYPPSNGYSGNTGSGHKTGGSTYHHTTHHSSSTHHSHHTSGKKISYHNRHYVYNPPSVIYHGSFEDHRTSYPVYTGVPPTYIYQYRSSGNKYGDLLSGLALYNLGRVTANKDAHHFYKTYERKPYEYCKFGVKYRTGYVEEMAVDCKAITYFIYEDQPIIYYNTSNIQNQTTVTTQIMYPNGTLVEPKNVTQYNILNGFPNIQMPIISTNNFTTGQQILPNGTLLTNSYQQTKNVVTSPDLISYNDPRFAGKPVKVDKDMECYVIRHTQFNEMKKSVSCELLQKYSSSLLNSGTMLKSSLSVMLVAFALYFY